MLLDSRHMIRCKAHGSQLFVWYGRRKVCTVCQGEKAQRAA